MVGLCSVWRWPLVDSGTLFEVSRVGWTGHPGVDDPRQPGPCMSSRAGSRKRNREDGQEKGQGKNGRTDRLESSE